MAGSNISFNIPLAVMDTAIEIISPCLQIVKKIPVLASVMRRRVSESYLAESFGLPSNKIAEVIRVGVSYKSVKLDTVDVVKLETVEGERHWLMDSGVTYHIHTREDVVGIPSCAL